VSGQRQQIDSERADIDRNLPGGLHGIGVHQRTAFVGYGRERRDRLNRPDLIVGVHHRYERGVGVDCLEQAIGGDDPGRVHREQRRAPASAGQRAERVQHRFVFDAGCDQVPPSGRLERLGRASDGKIVSLGPAADEHNLGRIGVQQGRHRGSRIVDRRLCLLAEMMNARWITEDSAGNLRKRLNDFGRERRRCVVVKVDTHDETFIVPLPLTHDNKRTRHPFVASRILAGHSTR